MADSARQSTQGGSSGFHTAEGTSVPNEGGTLGTATSDWEVALGNVAATRAGAPPDTKATSESGELELPIDKPEYKPISARMNDD